MVIAIASKILLKDKTKFIITVSGVALATLMVLALIGIYFGVAVAAGNIPLTAGAKYWIVQKGLQSQITSGSLLAPHQEQRLAQLPGIRTVTPIIANTTSAKAQKGKQFTASVVGYDTATGIGRSGTLYSGNGHLQPGQALVDRSLTQKYHLSQGSKLTIDNQAFTVAGSTQGTNIIDEQYIFIPFSDAVKMFDQANTVSYVSYYLINSPEPLATVRREVAAAFPASQVETKEEMAANNTAVIRNSFGPIVDLLVVVGLIVSAAIIGLTIYAATMEHAKEYGILKAVGVSNSKLYVIVLRQTLIASTTAFLAGVCLYLIVSVVAFYILPGVVLSIPWQYYGVTFGMTVAAGMLALLLPISKINSIDPAEAFNR